VDPLGVEEVVGEALRQSASTGDADDTEAAHAIVRRQRQVLGERHAIELSLREDHVLGVGEGVGIEQPDVLPRAGEVPAAEHLAADLHHLAARDVGDQDVVVKEVTIARHQPGGGQLLRRGLQTAGQ
jgi:hypothetical protein